MTWGMLGLGIFLFVMLELLLGIFSTDRNHDKWRSNFLEAHLFLVVCVLAIAGAWWVQRWDVWLWKVM